MWSPREAELRGPPGCAVARRCSFAPAAPGACARALGGLRVAVRTANAANPRGSKNPLFKDPSTKKAFRVWVLGPESLDTRYLDPLGMFVPKHGSIGSRILCVLGPCPMIFVYLHPQAECIFMNM